MSIIMNGGLASISSAVKNSAPSAATSNGTNGTAPPTEPLAKDLIDTMQGIFGKHPGYRTTHAKGLLVEGTFTPTSQAQTLSTAPHFKNSSTAVIARFSVGGGIPQIPDAHKQATPKGLAIRFLIDNETHTDLISHSFNGFATRTGEDFLTFLQLLVSVQVAQKLLDDAKARGGDTSKEQDNLNKAQATFGGFLGTHPSAARFVTGPQPNPHNYGTITYYEPNTHVLTDESGKVTNVRYRLDPADGEHLYSPGEAAKLAPNYLEDDLAQRFPQSPIVLTVQAHIADPTDILDDATVPYRSTTFIPVGRLEINKVCDDNAARQQEIAFSPSPEKGGVEGITSSKDPLIQIRKGVYWISSDQRRHEHQVE